MSETPATYTASNSGNPLQFAIYLARQAGELIVHERANAELGREYKNGNELVTSADLKADQLICDAITAEFPDHYILSEESSPSHGKVQELDKPVWIIDPIDGTVNFAHGLNQSAVSIAYVEEGELRFGVVFNPFTDELFAAGLGKGATLNGESIRVAEEERLDRAIIATGFPYVKTGLEPMVRRLAAVLQHCADIRRLGSAALDICFVAAGRLDGYYESLSVWDYAASQLIAREAGAVYGHFGDIAEGDDPQVVSEPILVTNAALFEPLRALLRRA